MSTQDMIVYLSYQISLSVENARRELQDIVLVYTVLYVYIPPPFSRRVLYRPITILFTHLSYKQMS